MLRVSVAVIIVVVVSIAILFSPIIKIKSVEFNSQSCLMDQKLLEKYQVFGQNILFYKSTNLSDKLKGDFSCVDQLKIIKAYPSKLKIEVIAQKPVAKIDGTNFVVTQNGDITSANGQTLPTIFLPSSVKAASGQKIADKTILFALDVAYQLTKTDFTAQNIRIVETDDVALYNAAGLVALFSPGKDVTGQVDSLQQVLAKAKIDETKIAKIDLRFDKPVILNR